MQTTKKKLRSLFHLTSPPTIEGRETPLLPTQPESPCVIRGVRGDHPTPKMEKRNPLRITERNGCALPPPSSQIAYLQYLK
ncbi:hypothetical protein TNCV_978021 [Trichonephila clavipes]|nr:hypothetical protein TNCV_978021 [Trichonephila clavipes]